MLLYNPGWDTWNKWRPIRLLARVHRSITAGLLAGEEWNGLGIGQVEKRKGYHHTKQKKGLWSLGNKRHQWGVSFFLFLVPAEQPSTAKFWCSACAFELKEDAKKNHLEKSKKSRRGENTRAGWQPPSKKRRTGVRGHASHSWRRDDVCDLSLF